MEHPKLTPFQHTQLLSVHLEGDWQYKNPDTGHKYPANAFRSAVDTLISAGLVVIKGRTFLTAQGLRVLDKLEGRTR